MITAAHLRTQTVKELGQLAKQLGLTGWYSMRKDQLVTALVRTAKRQNGPVARGSSRRRSGGRRTEARSVKAKLPGSISPSSSLRKSRSSSRTKSSDSKKTRTRVAGSLPRKSARIKRVQARRRMFKDLSIASSLAGQAAAKEPASANGKSRSSVRQKGSSRTERGNSSGKRDTSKRTRGKDRIVLLVRDAFWLQVCWEVTRRSVQRAKSAMAENWHTAKPVLRVYELLEGKQNRTAERISRDIEIHGGVTNWYIDVVDPPRSYRVDLGYLAANDKFYSLARSNTVTTPTPGSSDTIDENWTDIAENYEKIYALSGGNDEVNAVSELQELFEERLRRPMGSSLVTRYGISGDHTLEEKDGFVFSVDAEIIIFGNTMPDAHVTLLGEPVKVRSDGTFTVRLSMPDKRQVIPVVASSKDGIRQQTIAVAVERNTKIMERLIREAD